MYGLGHFVFDVRLGWSDKDLKQGWACLRIAGHDGSLSPDRHGTGHPARLAVY